MIAAVTVPGHLAIENHLVDGEVANGGGDCGQVLGEPVAREEPNVAAVFVCESLMPSNLRSKIQSSPAKRSCVSVAAIGSSQSGIATLSVAHPDTSAEKYKPAAGMVSERGARAEND